MVSVWGGIKIAAKVVTFPAWGTGVGIAAAIDKALHWNTKTFANAIEDRMDSWKDSDSYLSQKFGHGRRYVGDAVTNHVGLKSWNATKVFGRYIASFADSFDKWGAAGRAERTLAALKDKEERIEWKHAADGAIDQEKLDRTALIQAREEAKAKTRALDKDFTTVLDAVDGIHSKSGKTAVAEKLKKFEEETARVGSSAHATAYQDAKTKREVLEHSHEVGTEAVPHRIDAALAAKLGAATTADRAGVVVKSVDRSKVDGVQARFARDNDASTYDRSTGTGKIVYDDVRFPADSSKDANYQAERRAHQIVVEMDKGHAKKVMAGAKAEFAMVVEGNLLSQQGGKASCKDFGKGVKVEFRIVEKDLAHVPGVSGTLSGLMGATPGGGGHRNPFAARADSGPSVGGGSRR